VKGWRKMPRRVTEWTGQRLWEGTSKKSIREQQLECLSELFTGDNTTPILVVADHCAAIGWRNGYGAWLYRLIDVAPGYTDKFELRGGVTMMAVETRQQQLFYMRRHIAQIEYDSTKRESVKWIHPRDVEGIHEHESWMNCQEAVAS